MRKKPNKRQHSGPSNGGATLLTVGLGCFPWLHSTNFMDLSFNHKTLNFCLNEHMILSHHHP